MAVYVFINPSHDQTLMLGVLARRWGQVFILDSLSRYKAKDARDAESIVERVTPRLQHANCAVVLSSVKVIMQQLELITSTGEVARNLTTLVIVSRWVDGKIVAVNADVDSNSGFNSW